jgi:nucleoside-diphosphate-sugar epimerase
LPITIVRPFNTYGPRQSARAVIPTIITQLLNKQKVLKLGDTTPTRDFTFVKDTVRGFSAIAKSDNTIGEEINIASQTEISVGDMANLLIEKIFPEATIAQEENRMRPAKSEVMRLFGSNEKIKSLTDWKPEVSLENGLTQCIEWFSKKENLSQYKHEIFNL